jgi:hypothetical protein
MTKTRPATIQDLSDLFDRMVGTFATKTDLKVLKTGLENTIAESTDEVLTAVNDRFDIVEGRLGRIENRLDRHLAR